MKSVFYYLFEIADLQNYCEYFLAVCQLCSSKICCLENPLYSNSKIVFKSTAIFKNILPQLGSNIKPVDYSLNSSIKNATHT